MSAVAPRRLRARDEILELGPRPVLMGIINASPESFSDGTEQGTVDDRVALAREMLAAGAGLLDVGGESGVTNRPPVPVEEEIRRVVPLIERLVGDLGARVSVDTYKVPVARAAIAAGASIVNDVSGLRDVELASICAETGAALVIMHTRAEPKQRRHDRSYDGRMFDDVRSFLAGRMALAISHGVGEEQIILDPGPDFGKTPAQSVEVMRRVAELHALGRPLLLPVSRKDFIGAVVPRRPRERLAGTLAAVGHSVRAGAQILRVHDVRAVADYIAVSEVLSGARELAPDAVVPEALRREAQG